jgi:uncharacterized damage-inducible protein DinB
MGDILRHLRDALGYVRWADGQAVAAARSVSDEEYFRERAISRGSIHKLLVHMMTAPHFWLTDWRGGSSAGLPDVSPAANPTLAHVAATWPRVHDAIGTFLDGLQPADLARPVRFVRDGREYTTSLADSITHVFDHATYHRGQLNTMVKQGGGTPIRVSYWVYAVQRLGA